MKEIKKYIQICIAVYNATELGSREDNNSVSFNFPKFHISFFVFTISVYEMYI